jgi:hypothetical protein
LPTQQAGASFDRRRHLSRARTQADEREKLRGAGRRKLEEFRRKKQLKTEPAPALPQPKPIPATLLPLLLPLSSSPAPGGLEQLMKEPPYTPRGISISLASSTAGHERDPLVDMLAAQVNALMQDKQRLHQEACRLQMENEQLQELVGFLTVQLEGSTPDNDGGCDSEEGMLVFTPEELQYAVHHSQQREQREQRQQQQQQQQQQALAGLVVLQGSREALPAVGMGSSSAGMGIAVA